MDADTQTRRWIALALSIVLVYVVGLFLSAWFSNPEK